MIIGPSMESENSLKKIKVKDVIKHYHLKPADPISIADKPEHLNEQRFPIDEELHEASLLLTNKVAIGGASTSKAQYQGDDDNSTI